MSFTKDQLLPDEQLVILERQHPVVLLRPVLLNIAFFIIVAGLGYVLHESWPSSYWLLLLCLVPLALLFWEYLVRHRREYIVTDRRVVKHEGVFTVSSFDAPLDKINNVFHEQSFLGRLLKYGRVGLETASEQGTTMFDFIPHPVEFKNYIVRQRELRTKSASSAQGPPQLNVAQLLNDLAGLRDRNIITAAEFESKKKALLDKI